MDESTPPRWVVEAWNLAARALAQRPVFAASTTSDGCMGGMRSDSVNGDCIGRQMRLEALCADAFSLCRRPTVKMPAATQKSVTSRSFLASSLKEESQLEIELGILNPWGNQCKAQPTGMSPAGKPLMGGDTTEVVDVGCPGQTGTVTC